VQSTFLSASSAILCRTAAWPHCAPHERAADTDPRDEDCRSHHDLVTQNGVVDALPPRTSPISVYAGLISLSTEVAYSLRSRMKRSWCALKLSTRCLISSRTETTFMGFKAEESSVRDPRSAASNRYGWHRGSGGSCGENVIPSVADVGLSRKDIQLGAAYGRAFKDRGERGT
jgi:hypothetical protein